MWCWKLGQVYTVLFSVSLVMSSQHPCQGLAYLKLPVLKGVGGGGGSFWGVIWGRTSSMFGFDLEARENRNVHDYER